MNDVALTLRQVRYEQKAFWRNPAAAFFTFIFPLLFLVIFTSLLGNGFALLPTGEEVTQATYYVASILTFSAITASYTNIAMSVVFARDEGVLKRVRGTPLPSGSYLVGKMLNSVVVMCLLLVIVVGFGVVFYDVHVPTTSLLAFLVTFIVGAASFCLMGLAVASFAPNAEAAPAIVNGIILPLLFVSGIFIPLEEAPGWMVTIGDVFPVKHLFAAATEAFIPTAADPSGWAGKDLLIVAAWGVGALAVAIRYFSWEPKR